LKLWPDSHVTKSDAVVDDEDCQKLTFCWEVFLKILQDQL